MKLLSQLHARFGDFWWYTCLQFAASRCGDLINAFIGLWLVPKYVGMEELGAVLPLMSFATFLSIPILAFTTALSKEVNVLVVRGELGKLKTLLRSIFIAAAVFLVVVTGVVRYGMPLILERIRVENGLLSVVVIATALVGSTAPVYMYSLQAMKRFGAFSFISLLCAPIRLMVMLLTMPIRALTGYFVGQIAGPGFQIVASIYALRHELNGSVPAERYWTKERAKSFAKYLFMSMIPMLAGGLVGFVEPLIIRQRLPMLDSAAYYMISRFAEIGSYLGMTLSIIVFPYVSEATETGRGGSGIVIKAFVGTSVFGIICALIFLGFGRSILTLLPQGETFCEYVPEMVSLTIILALRMAIVCFTTGETAASRFQWLWWMVPLDILYSGFLFITTGAGYLRGIVSDGVCGLIESFAACHLDILLWQMAVITVLKLVFVSVHFSRRRVK